MEVLSITNGSTKTKMARSRGRRKELWETGDHQLLVFCMSVFNMLKTAQFTIYQYGPYGLGRASHRSTDPGDRSVV
jgi:hypothetical protein